MVCEGVTGGGYVEFNPRESYSTKTRKVDGKEREIAIQNNRAYVQINGGWVELDKVKKGNIFHKAQYAFSKENFKSFVDHKLSEEQPDDDSHVSLKEIRESLPNGFKLERQEE